MKKQLAKELKEAKFPHNTEIASPTLSELIEACGENFKSLTYYDENKFGKDEKKLMKQIFKDSSLKSEWRVLSYSFSGYIEGKTPEEAVAKLWLALNNRVI